MWRSVLESPYVAHHALTVWAYKTYRYMFVIVRMVSLIIIKNIGRCFKGYRNSREILSIQQSALSSVPTTENRRKRLNPTGRSYENSETRIPVGFCRPYRIRSDLVSDFLTWDTHNHLEYIINIIYCRISLVTGTSFYCLFKYFRNNGSCKVKLHCIGNRLCF